ncbi:AI-2E family transporter [Tsukamurella sp. 8F]|uniref:AI-2E family transporter n=1 Tax=unclassified Tsukamurella TaxID=2633480 RepID=UPI0023B917ED|nr:MULTISPECIES: AI-2E family transporter [unclassified Tsukamurella]MDF0532618.1 AI-2E family transporter [Tsukamurella sp. 8J]MDF0588636.1 AI-2E family transporter [Tsukamurella sp. 8F]
MSVPPLVRATAEWAWRLVAIAVAGVILWKLMTVLETVVIPLALAVLGAALLGPLVNWLHDHHVPRSLSVLLSLLLAIGAVAGILTFVVQRAITGVPELSAQVTVSIQKTQTWLADGPMHIRQEQITKIGDSLVGAIQRNQDALTSGALTTAATFGEIATGLLLMLFSLIFFLSGGASIWEFVTRAVPVGTRTRVRRAGARGFHSLVGYVRATVVVAAVDGIFIGIGLAILGVPLALPLGTLVFIGAFIPIIGAFVTGFVAVLVALVAKGPIFALIALAIVVGVMQIEGHVLQPLLLGRAVRLHPLAVVLAIAAGAVLGGIVGALLAVPTVAVLNTAVRSLLDPDDPELPEPGLPGAPYPPKDDGDPPGDGTDQPGDGTDQPGDGTDPSAPERGGEPGAAATS